MMHSSGHVSTSSYLPKFKITLKITPRPLTITAASDTKVYDGTALTSDAFTVVGLASTDVASATTNGSQTCVGESANTITSYQVMNGSDDVTGNYTVTTVDGLLKVNPITAGFSCPGDVTVTLTEGTADTNLTTATTGTATLDPSVLGLPSTVLSHITIKNNLASVNPMAVGTHTVTWTLYDDCNNVMTTCDQTVTVKYEDCDGTIAVGSHTYGYKRIGYQCWFTENLREEYGDHHAYNDDPANLTKFGYLYSWYTAVNVTEGDVTATPDNSPVADDGTHYVQGVCPAGWAIPSQADVNILNTTVGDVDLLKDPSTEYWQPGYEGVGGTGFNARAGGFYNATMDRYEDLMTGFHFWMSDASAGTTSLVSACITYYCDSVLTNTTSIKSDRRSIRCLRKNAH